MSKAAERASTVNALRSESLMSRLTSTWMPSALPVTSAEILPLRSWLSPSLRSATVDVVTFRRSASATERSGASTGRCAGRKPTCETDFEPLAALPMMTVATMPTSRITVLMRKARERTAGDDLARRDKGNRLAGVEVQTAVRRSVGADRCSCGFAARWRRDRVRRDGTAQSSDGSSRANSRTGPVASAARSTV